MTARTIPSLCSLWAPWLIAFSLAACAPPKPRTTGAPTSTYRPSDQAAAPAPRDDDPVNSDILSREPWHYATAEGEIIRTSNYRIYAATDDPVIRNRLAMFLEHALAHYRTAITPLPAPQTKLDTYLMNNRPQWERITKQLMGPQAESLLKITRGGYASRGFGVFYSIGLFDTLAIAGHEGWHQFTQKTFKQPLPAWLEEGLATFMEGHRWEQNTPAFRPWSNVQRYDQLRKAGNLGQLLSLEELLDSRPQDFLDSTDDRVLTFYAQLWALVHFLNEGVGRKYAAGLRLAVIDAAEGRLRERSGTGVFHAYFTPDLDAANAEYSAFVTALTKTGSRGSVVDGRCPIELNAQ